MFSILCSMQPNWGSLKWGKVRDPGPVGKVLAERKGTLTLRKHSWKETKLP